MSPFGLSSLLGGHDPFGFRPVLVTVRPRYSAHCVGGRRYDHSMEELNRRFRHLDLGRDPPRRGFGQRLRGMSQVVARSAFGPRRHSPDRPQREISVPGYQTVKALATGGMSDAILLVKDRRQGKLFIAKRASASGSHYERAAAELRTLNSIRGGENLNINYMVEHFWGSNRTHLTFVLEYCDAGNLENMIQLYRRRGQLIGESFLWHVMLGIANALAYLHYGIDDAASGSQPVRNWNTICHLDIKPPNVFLSNSGRTNSHPRIVLGDFGCTVSQSDIYRGNAHPRRQVAGTPGWYPPEGESRSGERRYGPASDIWMLGATIQALARRLAAPDKITLSGSMPLSISYGRTLNRFVGQASSRNFRDRPNAQQLVRDIVRRGQ